MPRVNVWLPDELHATLKDRLPDLNVSQLLQDAIRAVLACRHDELTCATCAAPVDRWAMLDEHLGRFYADLVTALEALIARVGTAEGAARVVREVALRWRVPRAEQIPLPRPTRAEREAAKAGTPRGPLPAWWADAATQVRPLPTEAGARRRHPTARATGRRSTTPAPAPAREETA